LKEFCKEKGLKYCMFLIFLFYFLFFFLLFSKINLIADNKEKLAKKIGKWGKNASSLEQLKQEILDYINPTATHSDATKPAIPQLYSDIFNSVDHFNYLRKILKYKPRISSELLRLLIGLIENAAVEIRVVLKDWKSKTNVELNKITI
jgi:hypothetical protein